MESSCWLNGQVWKRYHNEPEDIRWKESEESYWPQRPLLWIQRLIFSVLCEQFRPADPKCNGQPTPSRRLNGKDEPRRKHQRRQLPPYLPKTSRLTGPLGRPVHPEQWNREDPNAHQHSNRQVDRNASQAVGSSRLHLQSRESHQKKRV
jgi:hypothetical protein